MPEIGWKNALLGILMGAGTLPNGYFYQLVRGQEGIGLGDVMVDYQRFSLCV